MERVPKHPRRATAAVLAVLGAATLTACSGIIPGTAPEPDEPKISAIDLATGDQVEPVEVAVDGGAAGVGVTFREITIQPGAGTGEHCHYGQLIAVVQEGELTHYSETHPGGVRVYRAGESIIEGAGYPHEGRNEGDSDVVLWVTYVIPDGKPLAETDLADCEG